MRLARASAVSVPALLVAVLAADAPAHARRLGDLARDESRPPSALTCRRKDPPRRSSCQTDSGSTYVRPARSSCTRRQCGLAASLVGIGARRNTVFALTRLAAPLVLIVALWHAQPLWPEYTRLLAMNDGARVRRAVQQTIAATVAVGAIGMPVTLALGSWILALLRASRRRRSSCSRRLAGHCWLLDGSASWRPFLRPAA